MSPRSISTDGKDNLFYQLSIFQTALGWFGVVGGDSRVAALTFGHETVGDVHRRLHSEGIVSRQTTPGDWWPELRERLENYAGGASEDFADIPVMDQRRTDFQRAVVRTVRDVGFGETVSYGQLAERAGFPRAARAVGHVMATNPVPIIIPCHRVIASGGRLGGYTAPSGLQMKQRLLDLEGISIGANPP